MKLELLPPVKGQRRRRPTITLLLFFLGCFAIMWPCFIAVAVAVPAGSVLGQLLIYIGAFAPALCATLLTARDEGSAGVRALWGRVLRFEVGGRWYLFALGYMAAIKLTAALVHRVATGEWPRFGDALYLMPFAVALSTPVQAGEEVGWRGYALPRLAARFGLARASLLLGLIWAFWHVPQFYIRDGGSYQQSFFVYALQVTAVSVAMAWLYVRTGGSLFLTMLMHAAINNTKDIVPSAKLGATQVFGWDASLVAWITVALLWIPALYFLWWMARSERRRNASAALRAEPA